MPDVPVVVSDGDQYDLACVDAIMGRLCDAPRNCHDENAKKAKKAKACEDSPPAKRASKPPQTVFEWAGVAEAERCEASYLFNT